MVKLAEFTDTVLEWQSSLLASLPAEAPDNVTEFVIDFFETKVAESGYGADPSLQGRISNAKHSFVVRMTAAVMAEFEKAHD